MGGRALAKIIKDECASGIQPDKVGVRLPAMVKTDDIDSEDMRGVSLRLPADVRGARDEAPVGLKAVVVVFYGRGESRILGRGDVGAAHQMYVTFAMGAASLVQRCHSGRGGEILAP